MSAKRAGVFDAGEELDVSDFAPKTNNTAGTLAEQVRTVSEAAHFRSREPPQSSEPPPTVKREPRRYRTGRNTQLNIKARAEAIEAFYAIADQQGWVLGETFERAIDALRRDLSARAQ